MQDEQGSSVADCPFCERIADGLTGLSRGSAVAISDAFPVSPGHTLIVPRRHEADLLQLSEEEFADLWSLAREVCEQLRIEHGAQSFNLGVNVGAEAGQTIAHVHLHVIPRYPGDVEDPRGGVRHVIPRLAPYWEKE